MKILYELVTVIREQKPKYHWETGKMAYAMICKPGDLPDRCTETILFQTTSNWLYVKLAENCLGRQFFAGYLILCTNSLPLWEGVFFDHDAHGAAKSSACETLRGAVVCRRRIFLVEKKRRNSSESNFDGKLWNQL